MAAVAFVAGLLALLVHNDKGGALGRAVDSAANGITYPNVHDASGATLAKYARDGFPETWFVDRYGRLAAKHVVGPVKPGELDRDMGAARR